MLIQEGIYEEKKGCLFLETDDGGPLFLEDGPGLGGRVWGVVGAGVGLEGGEGVCVVVGEEVVEDCAVSVLCRYHRRCSGISHIQVLALSRRQQRHGCSLCVVGLFPWESLLFFSFFLSFLFSFLFSPFLSVSHAPLAPRPRPSPPPSLLPPTTRPRPRPNPNPTPSSPLPALPATLISPLPSRLCNRVKQRCRRGENRHRRCRRRPVRLKHPPPHPQCPRGPGLSRWSSCSRGSLSPR